VRHDVSGHSEFRISSQRTAPICLAVMLSRFRP
jgi:hypothetical protein